ncbi:MAG: CPBP family intramembrane glutamic endopeptidase [Acidimicrobiales bacterium]
MGEPTAVRRVTGETALVAAVVAFHVVDHRAVPEAWHPLTHATAGAAALGAGGLLGLDAADLGLDPARARDGLRAGLASGVVSAAAVAVAAALPATRRAFDDPRAAAGGGSSLARRLLLDIPVGTAVYEEAVFRGTLLGLARRELPPRAAEAVVAAVFGLWHVLPALEDREHNPVARRVPLLASVAPTVAATTVAGLVLGRLRDRTGSRLAPIVSHALTNAAGLLAARLVARAAPVPGDAAAEVPAGASPVRDAAERLP